ncbi:MAG: nucleotide exchange factor GrpE [Betaproteobacteria bacterium]|nr:nucleotide exchange factor GrpE [Betaproteobacteria bacterium]
MQDTQQTPSPTPVPETEPAPSEQPVVPTEGKAGPEAGTGQKLADTLAQLEESLKRAEQAAAEHHDAWLRSVAEADNISKRAQVDIANARKFAVESFSTELLAVKDSLETSLSVEKASIEQLKEGVELTLKLLTHVFAKMNTTEITPSAGEKFDPHQHQAMTLVESDAQAPNTVVHVMQKGYKLNDRVIRPALVTVAKARES